MALLGTRYTMEEGFLKDRLRERFGFEVLIPPETERGQVHRVIFEELVLGKILPQSKETYLRIIDGLVKQGAQGIILGCTEIGLLIQQSDRPNVPFFDTVRVHAEAAVDWALQE